MGKRLKENDFESIVTNYYVFGMNKAQIAQSKGISDTAVGYVVNTFNLVKNGDIETLIAKVKGGMAYPQCIFWAARKLEVDVPRDRIEAAYAERLSNKAREKKEPAPAEQITIEETIPTERHNESLFLDTLFDAITEQNALLTRLIEIVLPSCIGDIKDSMNVNTDVICERLKKCEDALDAIRCNSRKRGL